MYTPVYVRRMGSSRRLLPTLAFLACLMAPEYLAGGLPLLNSDLASGMFEASDSIQAAGITHTEAADMVFTALPDL